MAVTLTKDDLFERIMMNISFDGWTEKALDATAKTCNISKQEIFKFFPKGIKDVLKYLTEKSDALMLDIAKKADLQGMRIHEKIIFMVKTHFEVMAPYKEALKSGVKQLAKPSYMVEAQKSIWHTADTIWYEAGDNSTDYNHYTKRFLLSGVIKSTMLFWLNDQSENNQKSWEFLNKRIQNFLSFGKNVGKAKNLFKKIWPFSKK